MSVSYTLSWDEFLEVNRDWLPRPHVISLVCTIFIGVATGIFGILLVRFVDPQSRLVASVFCWLSLGLFLAAFLDFKVRTRWRRNRALLELRSIYDRYLSGEQTFTFDEEKWVHQTAAGKHEGLWGSLLGAAEWQNVITLSTADQRVFIPKRVLHKTSGDDPVKRRADAHATLRRLTLRPTGDAWTFRVGLLDYLVTEAASLWRTYPVLMAEAHLAGLTFFLMIVSGMYGKMAPGVIWGWVLAWFFLFLTGTTQYWYLLIKYKSSHRRLSTPWETQFSERGVHIKTAHVEFFVTWAIFRKFRETRKCFLLYYNTNKYYTFPKRCLSSEQQASLRQLLSSRPTIN